MKHDKTQAARLMTETKEPGEPQPHARGGSRGGAQPGGCRPPDLRAPAHSPEPPPSDSPLQPQGCVPASAAPPANLDTLDGLYLAGRVNGRQRRMFDKKGGGQRYVIVLSVLTASGLFKPERWCDSPSPSDVPKVGEHVCLPVGLQYYASRTGTAVRLVWGNTSQGEEF
jgi:hypothetical protein